MIYLLVSPLQATAADYEPANRVLHINRLLEAVRQADKDMLANTEKYIQVIDRNNCRSAYTNLRTNCLLEATSRNCRQSRGRLAKKQCRLVSDVIVANKLGEKEFIDVKTKYRIMKTYKAYNQELKRVLWRKYAGLVLGFYLNLLQQDEDDKLAEGIDQYCMLVGSRQRLSWQYCVAAMVWFIGTS